MPTKSASRIITRGQDWLGPAIPPGEILLEEYLKPLGLGQVQAAARLGISLNRLNVIVLGKRGITADTKPQKILFAQVLNHLLAVEPPDESADDQVQRNHALSLCQLRRSFRTLRVQSPRSHESQDRFASRTL